MVQRCLTAKSCHGVDAVRARCNNALQSDTVKLRICLDSDCHGAQGSPTVSVSEPPTWCMKDGSTMDPNFFGCVLLRCGRLICGAQFPSCLIGQHLRCPCDVRSV